MYRFAYLFIDIATEKERYLLAILVFIFKTSPFNDIIYDTFNFYALKKNITEKNLKSFNNVYCCLIFSLYFLF